MSKKEKLMKGFSNLLQSTEQNEAEIEEKDKKDDATKTKTSKSLNAQTSKRSNAQTSKSLNVQTSKHLNAQTPKYKELKKCTLYLPTELMDKLSYMKILTKKDLSVLTAEAIQDYLIKNNVKDIF